MQIKKSSTVYDVVIIGSGAGGGMAGYVLANAGIKVLMLEAGPFFDPAKDSQQLNGPTTHHVAGEMLQDRWGISMHHTEDEKWMANPIHKKMVQNFSGSVRGCLEEEQITGREFPCVWVPKISNAKPVTALATTGQ
jgi:choline dehydrogenase-like flavoprotein